MKVNLRSVPVLITVLLLISVKAQELCRKSFNETKGEIVTPGFPHRLEFNTSCIFTVSVDDGRVKWILKNVSLPRGALIYVDDLYYFVGDQELQSHVLYSRSSFSRILVALASHNASVTRDYKGLRVIYERISYDICKYTFQADTVEPKSIRSPGYPSYYTNNRTCEYFIHSSKGNRVHIGISELQISPGDEITIYDGRYDSILARYDGTPSIIKSVASNSTSVRVVFRPQDVPSSINRRFVINYQKLPRDSCLEEYYGKSGSLSSPNKSCVFKIRIPTGRIELKFENLSIAANNRIIVIHKRHSYRSDVTYLMPTDSGLVRYVVSAAKEDSFEIKFNRSAKFKLTFMEFKTVYSINLSGERGVLTSPHFPQTYPSELRIKYQVTVPDGHVKLNFTELSLSPSRYYWVYDTLMVYDGKNTTTAQLLATYKNNTVNGLPVIVSSNNSMTIVFRSFDFSQGEGKFKFKAVYSAETKVEYCKPLSWPAAEASRSRTIPGWTTKYTCKADYVNKDDPYSTRGVDRVCNFNGDWEPGKILHCVRRCQPLDESLKVNSTLAWYPSSKLPPIYVGRKVSFFCRQSLTWELIGPSEITCTSYGNYSRSPPTCKKRPELKVKDSNSGVEPWVYGVGAGGLTVIISIVLAVLRVCFGCFTCLASNSNQSAPISLAEMNTHEAKSYDEDLGPIASSKSQA